MKLPNVPRYGAHMESDTGYIAQLGKGGFDHAFGGVSWKACRPDIKRGSPVLLVTLDLRDPKVIALRTGGLKSLPLMIDAGGNLILRGVQRYKCDQDIQLVEFVGGAFSPTECGEDPRQPQRAFDERPLELHAMTLRDMPLDE